MSRSGKRERTGTGNRTGTGREWGTGWERDRNGNENYRRITRHIVAFHTLVDGFPGGTLVGLLAGLRLFSFRGR